MNLVAEFSEQTALSDTAFAADEDEVRSPCLVGARLRRCEGFKRRTEDLHFCATPHQGGAGEIALAGLLGFQRVIGPQGLVERAEQGRSAARSILRVLLQQPED